jgi:hypothetical protein
MHLRPEEEDVDIWDKRGEKAKTENNEQLVFSVGLQNVSFMNMEHIFCQVSYQYRWQ